MANERLDRLIAAAIRAERGRLKLSQEQLAERVGVSRPVITAIESGGRPLTLAETPRLCEALQVSLRQLLDRADVEDLERLGLASERGK